MNTPSDVAVIVGSLRKESFSRKMALALKMLAPPSMTLEIVEIAPLSFYNQDLDASPPDDWTAFRDRIRRAGAALFVTPEYNRSVPGVLKNAIDVASRPYGRSAWDRKPAGVVSVSPGSIGAFGANHHLRQSLVFLNMPVMQQPEAYYSGADKLFDATGALTNESTRAHLEKYLKAFEEWIARYHA